MSCFGPPLALRVVLLALCGCSCTHAQNVKFDGKFGHRVLTAPNYDILASDGLRKGDNLFHSFQQFDLVHGETATFFGEQGVQTKNVLSRVTGGKVSSIDGTIRTDPSTLAGANFFLINPSGILFGPNASMDVSGSVAFSTADYLKLADGARFVASLGADDSALGTASVSAFGFLNSNPGNINLQNAVLFVPGSKNLALVGGDITMDAGAILAAGFPQVASAAAVDLVSVQSPGELALDVTDFFATPNTKPFATLGAIELRNGTVIEAGEFGRVVTRCDSLRLDNATIRAVPAFEQAQLVTDGAVIDVECDSLALVNGAEISITSQTPSSAGRIVILANTVRVQGLGSAVRAVTEGERQGGNIFIRTGLLEILQGGVISSSTSGLGDAGNIDITATSIFLKNPAAQGFPFSGIQSDCSEGASGNGGNVTIQTETLELVNGAVITAFTEGSGDAGSIEIRAAKSIRLDGPGNNLAGIISNTETEGQGGDITIVTGKLKMFGGVELSADTFGSGNGGVVTITADSILLNPRGSPFLTEIAARSGPGASGNGGDVTIIAKTLKLLHGASITTSSEEPGTDAGNIHIMARDLVYLAGKQTQIRTESAGNGGDILIDPKFVVLDQGSISANAFGPLAANAGNVTIVADNIITDPKPARRLITATSAAGPQFDGQINIEATDLDLSGSLVGLPSGLLSAESQLRPHCGIRLSGGVSSFLVVGRGGLPLEPDGFAPSFMAEEPGTAPNESTKGTVK